MDWELPTVILCQTEATELLLKHFRSDWSRFLTEYNRSHQVYLRTTTPAFLVHSAKISDRQVSNILTCFNKKDEVNIKLISKYWQRLFVKYSVSLVWIFLFRSKIEFLSTFILKSEKYYSNFYTCIIKKSILHFSAMSHSNIYKKSSKSSLLSSKASLQDHSTTTDHPDKSSRSSLHDQSSRSGLHNRSSRTTVGFPSLHLSSTEDTDVFLDNSVENPIQKSRYSSQHSSHQMSSSNDRQHKVFQHFSETENLGSWKLYQHINPFL